MFRNNKVMQTFLGLLLLILDHLKSKHKLLKISQWYEMFQRHQGHVKRCKVPSRSYLYHVQPPQPLSLGLLVLELPVPSRSRDGRRPARVECTAVIKCINSRRWLQHKPASDMTDGHMEFCDKL